VQWQSAVNSGSPGVFGDGGQSVVSRLGGREFDERERCKADGYLCTST